MIISRFESEQYTSEAFVESAGAILFRLSTRKVCVLHILKRNEYVLVKGRRNCGESRHDAVLREITKESEFLCRLLHVNMFTRASLAVKTKQLDDETRFHVDICELFILQLRRLEKSDVKLIWWYIAAINEDQSFKRDLQKREKFAVNFINYIDVLKKLIFQMNRDMIRRAIDIVIDTYDKWTSLCRHVKTVTESWAKDTNTQSDSKVEQLLTYKTNLTKYSKINEKSICKSCSRMKSDIRILTMLNKVDFHQRFSWAFLILHFIIICESQ